jgi:hypothetical protein
LYSSNIEKAWFFASDGEVMCDTIREALGDFSKIPSPYKYCARLGLSLSLSFPTIQVPNEVVELVSGNRDYIGDSMS